jgi:hypothetical protein
LIEQIIARQCDSLKPLTSSEDQTLLDALFEIKKLKDERKVEKKKADGLKAEIKTRENRIKMQLGEHDSAILSDGRLLLVRTTTIEPRSQDGYSYTELIAKRLPVERRGRK